MRRTRLHDLFEFTTLVRSLHGHVHVRRRKHGFVTANCQVRSSSSSEIPLTKERHIIFKIIFRYLVKQFQGARSGGKLTPTLEYIRTVENQGTTVRRWDQTMESILLGFKEVSVGKLKTAVENLEKRQNDGIPQEDAWNMSHLELTGCAEVKKSFFYCLLFPRRKEKFIFFFSRLTAELSS